MPESFLWSIDYHGSLYKLPLNSLEWQCVSQENINLRKDTFKRISSTKTCAWAIGGDQNVHMCVFDTDLPIRVTASSYENERWAIRHGWSEKSLLFTDRWHWSSKDGKRKCTRESFELPSEGWSWDGDWYVDESIECDHQGWQYALDFKTHYHKSHGKLTFVRRRKWLRIRKFTKFNGWIKIPFPSSSEDPFQDITIGGYDIPAQADGFLVVWGITFSGKILYRHGVTRSCPEGIDWTDVPTEEVKLVQISVGPSGYLWGCTWDGQAVVRKGVTHSNPMGSSWEFVDSPFQNDLHQLTVGSKALWAITKNLKVYFRRGVQIQNKFQHNLDRKCNWVEMVGSFSLISVGPNDQIWAIGEDDRLLYIRTSVTSEELVGREWKLLKLNNVTKDTAMHWSWINSGACDVDSLFFDNLAGGLVSSISSLSLASNNENCIWRNDVLKSLYDRNTREIENVTDQFKRTSHNVLSTSWSKRGQCQLLIDKYYNSWCKCYIKLQTTGTDDNPKPSFLVYYNKKGSYKELIMPLDEIICVNQVKYFSFPYTFAVQTFNFGTVERTVVLTMDTEKMMEEWVTSTSPKQNLVSPGHITDGTLWATSDLGDIFCSTFSGLHWMQIKGHMKTVVSGSSGVTWGMGYDGKAYVYSVKQRFLQQSSIEERIIYENQRWNPIEGYSDRLLPSDRWNFSDETGLYDCAKDKYMLPSSKYKWMDDWEIDYDMDADDEGWQYAVDFPREYHKKRGIHDYIRRRKWKRLSKVSSSGPWLEIKTDVKICDISIDINNSTDSSVWVVSCNGDVIVRTGVSCECPQGTCWEYITTDTPVVSISVGAKSHVWCVCQDGSCLLRAGLKDNPQFGTNWFHVLKNDDMPMKGISAGSSIILAIDNQGTLYLRLDVTDTYPEGTRWEPVLEGVTAISVNCRDQVCLVQNNDVKLCLGVETGRFSENILLATLITDGWTSTCLRSAPHLDPIVCYDLEASNALQECVSDHETEEFSASVETNEQTEKVDPYCVDIYNFYKKNDGDPDDVTNSFL